MFCYQCQETMSGRGCTRGGICGKKTDLAELQDLLVWASKGLGAVTTQLRKEKKEIPVQADTLIRMNLCRTMTNAVFDNAVIERAIGETVAMTASLLPHVDKQEVLPDAARWAGKPEDYRDQAARIGIPQEQTGEDLVSFRETLTIALKGIAAYHLQAVELGGDDSDIDVFLQRALGQTLEEDLTGGNLLALLMEAGRYAIRAMDLLHRARIDAFGDPEPVDVPAASGGRPGILVSGNNMHDLAQLLEQTKDSGVDVYTHGELLSAHAYPKLRAYPHLAGHSGGSWIDQKETFAAFPGPILVTGENVVLPKASYQERLFTGDPVALPGCPGIRNEEGESDFSALIDMAVHSDPLSANEGKAWKTGYGYRALFDRGRDVARAIREEKIRKIAVILGDDGRVKKRVYYTDIPKALPQDVLILSAGSVVCRFPEQSGEIDGIPRFMHSGELADGYALIQFLLRLKEELTLDSLNQLPMFISLSWHAQRSVATLLALLYLDIKRIFLGPTRPAFLSEGVWNVLSTYFGVRDISTVHEDLESVLGAPEDLIRADMIIGDIVRTYPSLVPVMSGVGLHCIGCGVSEMENLEQACATHGLDVYDIMELLNDHLRKTSYEEKPEETH